MSMHILPGWVEAAIDAMEAYELRPRLIRRWREIELDVLPFLAELNDIEKEQVLDCVLWAGKYWQRSDSDRHRKALEEANAIWVRVSKQAAELADLISNLKDLLEENNLSPIFPTLWEIFEAAALDYPHWLYVMKGHGNWFEFLCAAKSQGRPKPQIEDLLFKFHLLIEQEPKIYSGICYALSRKRTADQIRLLLTQLRDNLAFPLLERGFKLPDQAVASLASILFDLDPPPTSDAVKMLRIRMQTED